MEKAEKATTFAKKLKEVLSRGVIVDILPDKQQFIDRVLSGEKLRFYIGADPTSSSLHLSHAKNYMLIEEFRKMGHKVFILIGDFTARIGDPTDKSAARKQLSGDDVSANVKNWLKQIKPIVDFNTEENPAEIVYNNEWLSKLSFQDVVELAANFTVQRMLERDMFQLRLRKEKPIFLHEFMYPLMQGYDSVHLDVDVELCGTDQTFNALAGRTLLRKYKQKDKFVMVVNLMENPKTKKLMSKSRGTGVFLDSSPEDMYGEIMAQPDEMIEVLLINNTRIPLADIAEMLKTRSPRDAKMATAYEITKIFHGEESAEDAQNRFIKKIQKKEAPDDTPMIVIGGEDTLFGILRKCINSDTSNSQIKRLIQQNAVRVDGKVVNDFDKQIHLKPEGSIMQVGKRKWFKIHTN